MPLDPNIEALLNEGDDEGPSFSLGVEASRAAEYDFIELCGPEEPVASVVDHRVPVDGGAITVRVYTPEGSGPFPAFVYFHGGGWVAGDINTMDRPCRTFANGGGCVVVSVEYRSRRSTGSRRRPRTAMPRPAGWPSTATSCGSIRPGSASAATAPAATSAR